MEDYIEVSRESVIEKLSQIRRTLEGCSHDELSGNILLELDDNLNSIQGMLSRHTAKQTVIAIELQPSSEISSSIQKPPVCTVSVENEEDITGLDGSELLNDLSAEDLFGDMDELDGSTQSLPQTAGALGQEDGDAGKEDGDVGDDEGDIPLIDDSHDDVPPPSQEHIDCLKKYFGHSSFRPMQWKIIRSVLVDRRDNLVIMATGYGKSLCYQFPAVYDRSRGVTFVVSPLISLMEDQVTSLKLAGIAACFLGSAQSDASVLRQVEDGKYQLVYITPEYLTTSEHFLTNMQLQFGINLIAIDEAHCVSQWGHDFRSSYRQLSCIRKAVPNVPILALTATATPSVRRDVCFSLKLRGPQVLCTSFDRPNLFFHARERSNNCAEDLKKFMHPTRSTGAMSLYEFPGATIVYCPSRKMTEEVFSVLQGLGVKAGLYHAGLSVIQRRATHQGFLMDKLQCVVATVAFGMGIDKPDVRLVIHYGVPKDIESYYQEMGRAGRDGLDSKCYVLYSYKDFVMCRALLSDITNDSFRKHKLEMISKLELYVSTTECRRRTLLSHFEDSLPATGKPKKKCCDNCDVKLSKPKQLAGNDSVDNDGKRDYGKEAFDLMSAISMWQRGMQSSILFLRGSSSSKLPDWCFKKSNFGCGRNISEAWWKGLGRMLRTCGYVEEETFSGSGSRGGGRGLRYGCTVHLSGKGTNLLRGWLAGEPKTLRLTPNQDMVNVEQREEKASQHMAAIRNTPAASIGAAGLLKVTSVALHNASSVEAIVEDGSEPTEEQQQAEALESQLYQELILVRAGIMSALQRDSFVIGAASLVSNLTLVKMAKLRPSSIDRLALVDGMSLEKAQKYGKVFVQAIVGFCKRHAVQSDADPRALVEKAPAKQALIRPSGMRKDLSQTVICSYNMFHEEGLSLAVIAKQRSYQPSTIGGHLVDAFQAGYPVDYIRAGFSASIQAQAVAAVKAAYDNPVVGEGAMKTAKTRCPNLDYWHIKLAIALLEEMSERQVAGAAPAPVTASVLSATSGYFTATHASSNAHSAQRQMASGSYGPTAHGGQSAGGRNGSAPPLKREHSEEDPSKRSLPNWLNPSGRVSHPMSGMGAPLAKKKKNIKL